MSFDFNDGKNANKNYLLSLQTRKAMACAVYETAPTSLEWKLQLAVRLTREKTYAAPDSTYLFSHSGKSDTRHLIGLHRFANENLLCGFSVCKSQYVYNKCAVIQDCMTWYYLDGRHVLQRRSWSSFVVVGRTRPWSMPLAILTIRKELHGFLFLCIRVVPFL